MINMIICKASHCKVAVVVVGLKPDVDTLLLTGLFGSSDEVFGKELRLLVEIVASALVVVSKDKRAGRSDILHRSECPAVHPSTS